MNWESMMNNTHKFSIYCTPVAEWTVEPQRMYSLWCQLLVKRSELPSNSCVPLTLFRKYITVVTAKNYIKGKQKEIYFKLIFKWFWNIQAELLWAAVITTKKMSKCYNYNCSKIFPGRNTAENTDQQEGNSSSEQMRHEKTFSSWHSHCVCPSGWANELYNQQLWGYLPFC